VVLTMRRATPRSVLVGIVLLSRDLAEALIVVGLSVVKRFGRLGYDATARFFARGFKTLSNADHALRSAVRDLKAQPPHSEQFGPQGEEAPVPKGSERSRTPHSQGSSGEETH
jgi:hypothetical protein